MGTRVSTFPSKKRVCIFNYIIVRTNMIFYQNNQTFFDRYLFLFRDRASENIERRQTEYREYIKSNETTENKMIFGTKRGSRVWILYVLSSPASIRTWKNRPINFFFYSHTRIERAIMPFKYNWFNFSAILLCKLIHSWWNDHIERSRKSYCVRILKELISLKKSNPLL